MIPTYNRVRFLPTTLQSVLGQDPGADRMQIEVVDNSSTGEVRDLVGRLGASRVQLHSVAERMSVTDAMNLCVERAAGQWVHILHDDDYVRPGFYERVAAAFVDRPDLGAVLCRFEFVDANNQPFKLSALEQDQAGVLTGWLDRIAVSCRVQFPAIVVSRAAYSAVGAFDSRLEHSADWDMWRRIAVHFPVGYLPDVLASYRVHSRSDTTRLMRTGANVVDVRKSIHMSKAYLPQADWPRLRRQALRTCARDAANNADQLLKEGDRAAAWAQIREGWKTDPSAWYLLKLLQVMARQARR